VPCLIRHLPLHHDAGAPGSTPPDQSVANLGEAIQFENKDGVYAVFATWNGRRVVSLSRHFDRLEDSARRAGFSVTLHREALREDLRQLLRDTGFEEARFRISARPQSDLLMASVEPYAGPPVELQRLGVRCGTLTFGARSNPRAKQTSWILRRSEFQKDDGACYEHILVDQSGHLLEGTSSNFYVVRRITKAPDTVADGLGDLMLQTADAGILPGISRAIVIEVAAEVVRVDLTAPRLADRGEFIEAFLTSASRGIVPIIAIDGQPVGIGHPGPLTTDLIDRYNRRAEELEEAL
jgi:branched-chain amino acid aminotransferase